MSVVEQFDKNIDAAIKRGSLNRAENGAMIEVARKLAELIDTPEWPMVNGKIDNVSPAVFLKYCDALGIMPNIDTAKTKQKAKLAAITTSSKFAKASNG